MLVTKLLRLVALVLLRSTTGLWRSALVFCTCLYSRKLWGRPRCAYIWSWIEPVGRSQCLFNQSRRPKWLTVGYSGRPWLSVTGFNSYIYIYMMRFLRAIFAIKKEREMPILIIINQSHPPRRRSLNKLANHIVEGHRFNFRTYNLSWGTIHLPTSTERDYFAL